MQRGKFSAKKRIPILMIIGLVIVAAYRFIGLDFGEMQPWDEAIYALRTLAVVKFGAWWDQSGHMLRGIYYSAHPPLFIWLNASLYHLFGNSLWVFRAGSAAAGGIAVFALFIAARKILNRDYAFWTAAFLALMPLTAFYSRQGQLDVPLMAAISGSIAFIFAFFKTGKQSWLILAGIVFGLGLMTKMLFAMILPITFFFAVLLLKGGNRKSLLWSALVFFLISIPIWLPWYASLTIAHGEGNPLFWFSSAIPVGQVLSGGEGGERDLGRFYIVNQLVAHLSFLIPFTIAGIVVNLRRRDNAPRLFLAVFSLFYPAIIIFGRSPFVYYLIPALPGMLILAFDTFKQSRQWKPRHQLMIVMCALITGAWSISPEARVALKDALKSAFQGQPLTSEPTIMVFVSAAMCAVALAAVYLFYYKKGQMLKLLSVRAVAMLTLFMAANTMIKIWVSDPETYNDGVQNIVARMDHNEIGNIVFVNTGDNPQWTYYLDGEDIGWKNDAQRTIVYYQPNTMTLGELREKLDRMKQRPYAAVIINKTHIPAKSKEVLAAMLPPGWHWFADTREYAAAWNVP